MIYPVVGLCFLVFTCYIGCRVLMPLFALKLSASEVQIGALMAMYAVFPLALSIHAGRVADRAGSYRPVLYGLIGYAVGLVLPVFMPTMTGLYLSAALSGLSLVFFGVATQNLISSIGDANARKHNVSVYSIGLALSSFAGPMFTGYLIDHHGHLTTYAVLSGLCAAGALGWFAYRRHVPRVSRPAATATIAGVVELVRNRPLREIVIVSGIVVAGVDLFAFYMPIYGHSINLSATAIGAILGAQAIASLVVRGFMPLILKRYREENVLAAAMALAAFAFVLTPFFSTFAMLVTISFLLGLGLGCGQPLSLLLVFNRSPAGRSGEALGVRSAVINVMHLMIPLTFGAVSALLGLIPVFLVNAGLMAGGGYLSYRGGKESAKAHTKAH